MKGTLVALAARTNKVRTHTLVSR